MNVWPLVNNSINIGFDLYLWPFHLLSSTWQVCALAIPAAVLALLVYRVTSNQAQIHQTKDKIKAHLLELLIFKDDLAVMARAQVRILRYTISYMRLALVPMAVMILPFIFFLIQIESRFAFRSLEPGESTILSVRLNPGGPVSGLPIGLDLPAGLARETPALRVDETDEIFWRLGAVTPGSYRIAITIRDSKVTKRAIVGELVGAVSPAIYRASDIRTLAYPAETPLPDDTPVLVIRLDYPRAREEFAGLSSASWLFVGMSLLFGFLLRPLFKVTF